MSAPTKTSTNSLTLPSRSIAPATIASPSGNVSHTGNVKVNPQNSQFDAPGNDNKNKNEEYVCFTNYDSKAVSLKGWVVHDEYGWEYRFGDVTLSPGGSVQLHTGCGQDTATDVYWCHGKTAIWNNGGDTVYLYDVTGALVEKYHYGG
jgi:micrococcal nuclease